MDQLSSIFNINIKDPSEWDRGLFPDEPRYWNWTGLWTAKNVSDALKSEMDPQKDLTSFMRTTQVAMREALAKKLPNVYEPPLFEPHIWHLYPGEHRDTMVAKILIAFMRQAFYCYPGRMNYPPLVLIKINRYLGGILSTGGVEDPARPHRSLLEATAAFDWVLYESSYPKAHESLAGRSDAFRRYVKFFNEMYYSAIEVTK